ncbi:hypothetical protein C2G38_2125403 [Gigaspora rosea]|uniref:Serine-threonine/tyrosine-protein kinase catalytic domain-containing protein n=1 Tax=Gigaspora rosea TaxID=44941 RepID=A0A397U4M0_9GLOM|nr:hypothetical protein C2G38_2125403 [Gigaspora rosea]
MWEILYENLRPKIIEDTPQCYINLMKKCWERDSIKRPSAQKIIEILTEWQNDKNILLELTKSEELLKNQSIHMQSNSDSSDGSDGSDGSYKSKFIEFTTSFYQVI